MSGISKEYIKSVVDNIAAANNLTDLNYTQEKFKTIAQNFFGELVPITLKGKNNEKNVSIEMVLKLAPAADGYRISGAVTLMFAREIYVYTCLLEKYRIIQDRFPTRLQHLMPKCYYTCKDYCKEAIAMDNMCANGYEPFTSSHFLDYDHTVLSLQSLAKFHALSFILRERDEKTFNDVEKICVPLTETTNNRFMTILLDRLQKAIDTFEGTTRYIGLLRHMKEHCIKHVEIASFAVRKKCICHGDIWKENILFKYDENHKPIGACLIDYQTVRVSSAAYDTLFLLTTSTSKSLRDNGAYYKLLDVYFEVFANVLSAAGLVPDKVYSRKMFDEDLKLVAPACFIIANTALWLSSGLQQEGHVRSKQVFKAPEDKQKAESKYRSIIEDIIRDYTCYGYFGPFDCSYFLSTFSK